MDKELSRRKILCIGGSYFKRVQSELEKIGYRYIFLTNVQLLFAEDLPPRKREIKRNFFNNLRNELDENTIILLNLTGNSLFLNRCRQNHHNPESRLCFDNQKMESYLSNMTSLIRFMLAGLKGKGLSWEELKERVVILPTSPRFIFKCCNNTQHHVQDMKTIHDTITELQKQLKDHFVTRNIPMVKVIPLRHWMNFILLNVGIYKIFGNDMTILKNLSKKKFQFSFKKLGAHKSAQKIILYHIMDMERDNGLHIRPEYNELWIKYLHNLKDPDFSPYSRTYKKLSIYYEEIKMYY